MMTTKTLPKSLHTITVIVKVAAHYKAISGCTREVAVQATLAMLGHANSDDTYGLAAKALELLTKDR